MDSVKMNIKALANLNNETIEDLAKRAEIEVSHLYNISSGRCEMSATDLVKLSMATGIPERNIQIDY